MTITLESLGLTRDDILERVVAKIADELLAEYVPGDDDEPSAMPTPFNARLERLVLERVNQAVEEIAGRNVLPNVAAYVEGLCLQETNRWGEKTGKSLTFLEYLVQRAENYLREEVNYDGKARAEDTFSSSWKPAGTRIAYMVNRHLQYSIQGAMEQALKTANTAIVGGIEEAIKIKLGEVLAALKVKVETGR